MAIYEKPGERFLIEFQFRGRRVKRWVPSGLSRADAEAMEHRVRRELFDTLVLGRTPDVVYAKADRDSSDQWLAIADMLLHAIPIGPYPGVYLLSNEGRLVYVGRARNVANRLVGHRGKGYDRAVMIPMPAGDTGRAERFLITMLRPPLNVKGRKACGICVGSRVRLCLPVGSVKGLIS